MDPLSLQRMVGHNFSTFYQMLLRSLRFNPCYNPWMLWRNICWIYIAVQLDMIQNEGCEWCMRQQSVGLIELRWTMAVVTLNREFVEVKFSDGLNVLELALFYFGHRTSLSGQPRLPAEEKCRKKLCKFSECSRYFSIGTKVLKPLFCASDWNVPLPWIPN